MCKWEERKTAEEDTQPLLVCTGNHNCCLLKGKKHHSPLHLFYLQGANRGLRKASPSLWMSLMPSFLSVDCLLSKSCFFCRHCSTVAAGQQKYDVIKTLKWWLQRHFYSLRRGTALFVFICSQHLKAEWTFIIKWTVKMHLKYIQKSYNMHQSLLSIDENASK